MFKVGDQVRLKKGADRLGAGITINDVCTVLSVDESNNLINYRDESTGFMWGGLISSFELIESSEPTNGDITGCGGKRFNQGKLAWHLIPLSALAPVVRVLEMGLKKYGEGNWQKGMSWTVVYDCLMRHLQAWYEGEDTDKESGENHLAHVICNGIFLMWYALNQKGVDDRKGENR